MTGLRGLAFLFAVCLALAGCTTQVIEESDGCDMRELLDGKLNRAEHWGGLRDIPITHNWGENEKITVVSKPPYKALLNRQPVLCVPQVQSALLIARVIPNPNDASNNYAFRWVLSVGAGGTRSEIKLDALNTQQVSVAGEDLRADLLCERLIPDTTIAWERPQVGVVGGVTFADGNVQSGQATYTQKFNIQGPGSFTFPIPPMATGWRVLGDSTAAAATSPFQVGMIYITQGFGGAQLTGDQLTNKDPFVALAGVATGLRVSNTTANLVQGLLQWGLDL